MVCTTTLKSRALSKVRVEESVWVVHTADRVIVKLDCAEGAELDRIEIPPRNPEPHGLSVCGDELLYCDATSGWVVQISL